MGYLIDLETRKGFIPTNNYLDSLKKNKGINIYKSIDSTNDKNNIYDFLMTKNIDYNVEVKVLKEYRHSDHYPIYVVI